MTTNSDAVTKVLSILKRRDKTASNAANIEFIRKFRPSLATGKPMGVSFYSNGKFDADLTEFFDRKDSTHAYLATQKSAEALRGGKADGKTTKEFDPKQVAMGKKVETEHTDSKAKAVEIAKDHLEEIPDYYTRLKHMESGAQKAASCLGYCLGYGGVARTR